MIKILDHTKSLSSLVTDTTNGLGQFQPLDAFVTEELNGIYEAEIVLLQTDKHYKDLQVNGLLKINAGEVIGEQIFRIYFISKPIDGKILIKCQHISYDLNKVPVRPFSATGAVQTKNRLLQNVDGTYPFDMMTDILNTSSYFSLDIPRNFRECLGGYEGSILDVFRPEYEWDNLLVKMLAHRGSDEGVRISYGKNLTDFKQEENIENVYTSVLGYAVKDGVTYTGDIYHKIVSNLPRVKIVDFSNEYSDTTPTTASLTQNAQDYATRNAIEVPNVSINISFVPLYQTEEYKNIAPLERVGLGDTVHVYFDKMDIEATSRVVKTRWNVNLNKYDSVELGETKANLTTLLEDAVQEAKENITIDAGYIENELNDMSQLIINGLGLHRTLVPVSTGGHRMYLHNKPTLAESDTQYMIGAGGFMISTDYGQTWNSGWDAQGNAVVNSLATITLKALEIYGSYLCFGDYPNGKYIEATTYSNSSSVQQGVSFDGTGTIRMQPQEAFYVNNCTSDGSKYYNRIVMNKNYSATAGNTIGLTNYDDTQNYITANFIQMNAHYVSGSSTYNRTIIHNYATHTGESVSANLIMMEARDGVSYLYIRNRKQSGTLFANTINLSFTATQDTLSLLNYMRSYDRTANSITMTSTTSGSNTFNIDNYYNTNSYVLHNSIRFSSSANSGSIYIKNYKYGTSNDANSISLLNGSTNNSTYYRNYQKDYNYEANIIRFDAYGTYHSIYMTNSKIGANEEVNFLTMRADSNGDSYVQFANGRISTGTSSYTYGNRVELSTESGMNEIIFFNNLPSGSVANRIWLKSGPVATLELYSLSDILIDSSGAVRLTSGSSQDITLTASDDINIYASDKFYIAISGVQQQLYFGSDGNVKWM